MNPRLQLKVKQETDSGRVTVTRTTGAGDTVTFSKQFYDVDSLVVTAAGSNGEYAGRVFADVPNPSGFEVFLYDKNGTRITGTVDWIAKGVIAA